MITKLQPAKGNILSFVFSEKLQNKDYKIFSSEVEALIESQGKVRLLIKLVNFHGWDIKTAYEDIIFTIKNYNKLERLAIVGYKEWEKWMVKIAKPFTGAEVMFFSSDDIDDAWDWLLEK